MPMQYIPGTDLPLSESETRWSPYGAVLMNHRGTTTLWPEAGTKLYELGLITDKGDLTNKGWNAYITIAVSMKLERHTAADDYITKIPPERFKLVETADERLVENPA